MSLDAFSVVVAFLAAIEVVLGAAAAALGVRDLRRPPAADAGPDVRRPLLALVAATLVAVAIVSSPLFYLLLESWVPRWSGVMCVEGVRRIGTGSDGAVGLLPHLVAILDVAKPLVVFAAGAWLVLRRAVGATARRAAAIAAIALGLVAAVDGAAEAAYVVIPKQEVPANSGCCTTVTHAAARDAGLAPTGDGAPSGPRGLAAAFVASAAVLGAAALWARSACGPRGTGALLAAAAGATIPLATSYLADVVAPAVLHLPYHRCVWCAFAAAPETIGGAALHLGGVFCVGWAAVARLASAPGVDGTGPASRLYAAAGFCLLGAASMAAGLALTT